MSYIARVGIALALSILAVGHGVAETLYVFVPTEVRAKAMQEQISQVCPDINVTVFGKSKDFRKMVKKSPPEGILTLLPVIERMGPYSPVMKGERGGLTEEEYLLVSVDEPLNSADLSGKKLGVLDLLGRKPMGEFINQLVQADVKTKRVTKSEDLLPLLTFQAVDGLFIADSLFRKIKQKTNLNLVATSLNIKVGLVSAASNDDKSTSKMSVCIAGFGSSLNTLLGVEKWRTL